MDMSLSVMKNLPTPIKNNIDWDYDENEILRMSLYLAQYTAYENEVDEVPIKDIDQEVVMYNYVLKRRSVSDEEKSMVGINSNSLLPKNLNNMFLEWDHKDVDLDKLKQEDGTISETTKGYHFMKEARLELDELLDIQERWNCCKGFIKYLSINGFSTLRVSPKDNKPIKIIHYADGLICNIYKNIVLKMGGQYELHK
jgi:hypothetical protein